MFLNSSMYSVNINLVLKNNFLNVLFEILSDTILIDIKDHYVNKQNYFSLKCLCA